MSSKALGAASLFVLAACAAVPTGAESVRSTPTTDALSQCFEAQSQALPFAGVVLAERDGESFFRAAGHLDAEKTPMRRDARFRLASVQKVITRAAIARLVEEGRVSLDAPVGSYVPGLPADMAAATIDQLLQHRSGVTGLTRLTPELARTIRTAKTARDLLPAIVSQPLGFKPGEREEYSNGGYMLLGVVIESVTGKTYGEYIEQAIFRPLGMASTSLEADSRTASPMSRMAPGQPPLETARPIPSAMVRPGTAAGDGLSTADDLLKLGRALAGDALISPAVKARVFPKKGGVWRIGQSGGNVGVNADLTVFPENGWVVAVLSNYDPPAAETMGEVLRGVLTGKGCTTLTERDRPSPFQRLAPPAQERRS